MLWWWLLRLAVLHQLFTVAQTSEPAERCSFVDSAVETPTGDAALLQAATVRSKRVDAPNEVPATAALPPVPVAGVELPAVLLTPSAAVEPSRRDTSSSVVKPQRQVQQRAQAVVEQTPVMQAEAAERMSVERPAAAASVPVAAPVDHPQVGLIKTAAMEAQEKESLLPLAQDSILALSQQTREQFPMSLVYVFPTMKTDDVGAVFILAAVSVSLWCVLVWGAACFYRHQKRFPQAISSRPEQDFKEWSSGPFDVFQDCSVCCWAIWCPCIRWADNMDMMGFVSFWVALLIFCGVILLNTVPGGILLWLVASLLWMSYRQQLRKKFDMPHSNFGTYAGDWVLYCCCWPCTIAQEARHIEEAARAAHKAVRKSETV
mmetsp:Transcript_13920/g.24344  ORF Transcript_13920/g.24344 Transcript_13920/m.24344 type:complete len:375 (-) Transcript_13920:58-1182(-)